MSQGRPNTGTITRFSLLGAHGEIPFLKDLNRRNGKITANGRNSDTGVALKTPSTSAPSVLASPFRRSVEHTGTRGWKSINWLALAGMGNVSAWSGPSSVLLPPNALHLDSSTLTAPQRIPTIPPWLHVKMRNSGEMGKKASQSLHVSKRRGSCGGGRRVPRLRPGRAGANQLQVCSNRRH